MRCNNFNNSSPYVDISSYTASYYTTPNDGYLQFQGTNCIVNIISASNTKNVMASAQTGNSNVTHCIFIRKGMRLQCVGTFVFARFFKLE